MVGWRSVATEAIIRCAPGDGDRRACVAGRRALIGRAQQAVADNDLRLACHLADLAGWAAPDDPAIHAARADVYIERRKAEPSLMSKGIFMAAHANRSPSSSPQLPNDTSANAVAAKARPTACVLLTRS